jgi:hypothetical protein
VISSSPSASRYATLDWLGEFRAAYDAMRAGDVARSSAAFQALHAQYGDPVSAYHARLRQAV